MRLHEITAKIPKTHTIHLEKPNPTDEDILVDVWPEIEMKCAEILHIYRQAKGFIYRGVKVSTDAFKSNILKNRKPGFLSPTMHRIFNKALTERGAVAHRGNSIFCSASRLTADDWGVNFIVFPHDGFHSTVFPNYPKRYMFDKLELADYQETMKDKISVVSQILDEHPPKTNRASLIQAIQNSQEIMITGDWYIGLHAATFSEVLKKELF